MKIPAIKVAALSLAMLAATAHGQITKDLVVHLTFDGTNSVGNYTNAVANSIEGIPVGSPAAVQGLIGPGAVSLTSDGGLFNYISLGYPAELQFGAVSDNTDSDFTVAFWCNYTNQANDPVFIASQNWANSSNPGWGIYMQSGGGERIVAAAPRTQISNPPGGLLRDGTWHHVAVTFERRGNMSFYKDGALVAATSMAGTTGSLDTAANGYNVNIGQDGTGAYVAKIVDLFMDDLGLWRRVLSPGEVLAIYSAGLGGTNLSRVPAIVNPYVKSTNPANGTAAVAPNLPSITAVISDGLNTVAPGSIQFRLNGTTAQVVSSKQGSDTTVTYTNSGLLQPGDNTVTLIFANNASPQVFFTNSWTFNVSSYLTLTPALKVNPDASKSGFVFNIFANSANTAGNNARAESALAGQLLDPNTGEPLPNLADPAAQGIASAPGTAPNPANATIRFEIPTVINLNAVGGSTAGNFTPDDQMPGMPATDFLPDGAAAEVITYLSLPAGLTTMGVNSDDGFVTKVGFPPQAAIGSTVAGQFDGTRATGNTEFYINVQEAGTYGFRTVWQNATGGSELEWYTVKPDGTRVLLNDTANGGIPAYRATATAFPPYVKFVKPTPAPRQDNQLSSSVVVVLADGGTAVDDASIQFKVDGAVVPASPVRAGSQVTLTYSPSTIQFPEAQHLAELSFKSAGSAATNTVLWSFCSLNNVVLPAAAILETFDSYTEGEIPTGWTQTNYTDCSGAFCASPGLDLGNLESDTYRGWVVISQGGLAGLKGRIFQGIAPNQYSNGVALAISDLSSGNLIYAESDVRDGNQVQFLYSKPYNLAALRSVAISFCSLYEQNQDNSAGVEYSVDGGNTWLPVVYYLDFVDGGGDIRYNPDGSVDAVTTFKAPNPDTAIWSVNGVTKGGNYGDALAAPITQALGRFVAPRANDDRYDGKRFEIYRLPGAGGKADVRLRFFQIGTGSWYFGVDKLAFYDVAVPVQPRLAVSKGSASTLSLNWIGAGTLQEAASPAGPWTVSADQGNPQAITMGSNTRFFRIGLP